MKFTILSNGDFHINCGAKSNNTKGKGVLDNIFGGSMKSSKNNNTNTNTPQLDCQLFDGSIDGNLNSSIEMEIGIDEFKELSVFCKEHLNLEKEGVKFIYHGIKQFLDDIIDGIKNRGKEVIDTVGNLNKDYLRKKAEIDRLEKELKEENKNK